MTPGLVERAVAQRVEAELGLEEGQDGAVPRGLGWRRRAHDPRAAVERRGPLVLVGVDLLEREEGLHVVGGQPQDLAERVARPVDEATLLVVERQRHPHGDEFELVQPGLLQQLLVHGDRATDLPLLAIEVAEDEVHLERVLVLADDVRQLLDGRVEVRGHQEIEALQVVGRFAQPPAIDEATLAQLVAFPRLAEASPTSSAASTASSMA